MIESTLIDIQNLWECRAEASLSVGFEKAFKKSRWMTPPTLNELL